MDGVSVGIQPPDVGEGIKRVNKNKATITFEQAPAIVNMDSENKFQALFITRHSVVSCGERAGRKVEVIRKNGLVG